MLLSFGILYTLHKQTLYKFGSLSQFLSDFGVPFLAGETVDETERPSTSCLSSEAEGLHPFSTESVSLSSPWLLSATVGGFSSHASSSKSFPPSPFISGWTGKSGWTQEFLCLGSPTALFASQCLKSSRHFFFFSTKTSRDSLALVFMHCMQLPGVFKCPYGQRCFYSYVITILCKKVF